MKTAFLIGGGQSVNDGINLDLWNRIKGKDVWSLNFAFMTMPYFPSKQIWIDLSFFKNNMERLQKLYEDGVPCYTKKHNKYLGIQEINQYETTRSPMEIDKMFIGRMGLVGFFALSLAIKENYDLIYLLGFDFGSITNDNKTHFYQDKLSIVSSGVGKPDLYVNGTQTKDEVKDFEVIGVNAISKNIKIYNVSPLSRIPYFSKLSYEEFFKRIEEQ